MDKPLTEKQHFVPRTYLKRFATPESRNTNKPSIHRYLKGQQRYLGEKSVYSVAYENWFYSPPEDGKQLIEKSLAQLEGDATPILKRLTESGDLTTLSEKDKAVFAHFISAQHHRTQKFRTLLEDNLRATIELAENDREGLRRSVIYASQHNDLTRANLFGKTLAAKRREMENASRLSREMRRKAIRDINKKYKPHDKIVAAFDRDCRRNKVGEGLEDYVSRSKFFLNKSHFHHMVIMGQAIPAMTAVLKNMPWEIREYPEDGFRYTSDSPVVLKPLLCPAFENDHKAHYHFAATMLGVASFLEPEHYYANFPPTAFVFPLSPRYELYISPFGISNRKVVSDHEELHHANVFQVLQASRDIFSQTSDFSLVPKAVDMYNRSMEAYRLLYRVTVENQDSKDDRPYVERWKRFS